MVSIEELRQQIASSDVEIARKEKELAETRTGLTTAEQSLPETTSVQALRERFTGRTGIIARQQVAGIRGDIAQSRADIIPYEQELQAYRGEVSQAKANILGYEKQLSDYNANVDALNVAKKLVNKGIPSSAERGLVRKYMRELEQEINASEKLKKQFASGEIPTNIKSAVERLQQRGLSESKAYATLGIKMTSSPIMQSSDPFKSSNPFQSSGVLTASDIRSRYSDNVTPKSMTFGEKVINVGKKTIIPTVSFLGGNLDWQKKITQKTWELTASDKKKAEFNQTVSKYSEDYPQLLGQYPYAEYESLQRQANREYAKKNIPFMGIFDWGAGKIVGVSEKASTSLGFKPITEQQRQVETDIISDFLKISTFAPLMRTGAAQRTSKTVKTVQVKKVDPKKIEKLIKKFDDAYISEGKTGVLKELKAIKDAKGDVKGIENLLENLRSKGYIKSYIVDTTTGKYSVDTGIGSVTVKPATVTIDVSEPIRDLGFGQVKPLPVSEGTTGALFGNLPSMVQKGNEGKSVWTGYQGKSSWVGYEGQTGWIGYDTNINAWDNNQGKLKMGKLSDIWNKNELTNKSFTDTIKKTYSLTGLGSLGASKTGLSSLSALGNLSSTATDTLQKTRQKTQQKTLQLLKTLQQQQSLLKTKQKTQQLLKNQLSIARPRARTTPKKTIKKLFWFDSVGSGKLRKKITKENLVGGFKIFTKKYGKDILIGEKRNLEDSSRLLRQELKTTLRASGFITKYGKKIKINLGKGFLPSKKDPFRVVQKLGSRLSTKSEIWEISRAKQKKQGSTIGFKALKIKGVKNYTRKKKRRKK